MKLLGEKVRLRTADETDIHSLYTWWNDSEFNGEFSVAEPKSRADIESMVNRERGRLFIISTRSENKRIGFIDYYWIRSDYPYLFEIGYRVTPSERRKGYTTEAARLVVDHLFTTRKEVERIESVTDTANVASQRVLEKNGFRREGVLRKRFLNKGQYRDEYMYSLLRVAWQNAKAR